MQEGVYRSLEERYHVTSRPPYKLFYSLSIHLFLVNLFDEYYLNYSIGKSYFIYCLQHIYIYPNVYRTFGYIHAYIGMYARLIPMNMKSLIYPIAG